MSTDLRTCRVRVTEPVGADFVAEVIGVVRLGPGDEIVGPDLDPADPGVPLDLIPRAQARLAARFAPLYQRYVPGGVPRGLECVYEGARPLVTSEVELRADAILEHEGGRYRVSGRSRVVRKYYDGVLDAVRPDP